MFLNQVNNTQKKSKGKLKPKHLRKETEKKKK